MFDLVTLLYFGKLRSNL